MACVGDESPHPLFVALAGLQGRVDVVEKCVEGVTDAPDLGVLVDLRIRDAVGDRHRSLSHRNACHTLSRVGDHAKRPQAPAHDDRHGKPQEDESASGEEGDGRRDLRERRRHLTCGKTRRDREAAATEREHAVRSDTVDRDLAHGAALAGLNQLLHDLLDLRVIELGHGSVGVDVAARHRPEGGFDDDQEARLERARGQQCGGILRPRGDLGCIVDGPQGLRRGLRDLVVEVGLQDRSKDRSCRDTHRRKNQRDDRDDRDHEAPLETPGSPTAPVLRTHCALARLRRGTRLRHCALARLRRGTRLRHCAGALIM